MAPPRVLVWFILLVISSFTYQLMIITTTTAVPTWQKSRYVLKRDDRDVERIAETNEPGTFH